MATIYLALGTNVGCRLSQLRLALRALANIPDLIIQQLAPIYQSAALLTDDAPATWDQDYFNTVIQCQYPHAPEQLLDACKAIERQQGRQDSARWSPRAIDIDIIAWDDLILKQSGLNIPHYDILNRSFVIKPLLDINPHWQHPEQPDYDLFSLAETLGRHQQLSRSPLRLLPPFLVGTLNVTANSFSDGGLFDSIETASKQFCQLIADGAEIIDIGAESTNPRAALISPEEEWQRLEPILQACFEQLDRLPLIHQPKISIDTRHLETIKRLRDYPVHWINDVEGDQLQEKINLIKETPLRYVSMHHLGVPPSAEKIIQGNPLTVLKEFANQRIDTLLAYGLSEAQIIIDVGLGFGKDAQQTKYILKSLEEIIGDLPVTSLLGFSRKSFINHIHPMPAKQRDLETAVLSSLIGEKACDYLRIHQVEMIRRALSVKDWLNSANDSISLNDRLS